MKAYIVFLLPMIFSSNYIQSMERQNFMQESPGLFTNKTVFVYDGDIHNAYYIAQAAKMVYLDNYYEKDEKYTPLKNVMFAKPPLKTCDIVTVYNPLVLNCSVTFFDKLCSIKSYLKENGEIHALTRSQKDHPVFQDMIFLSMHQEVCALLTPQKREELKPEECLSLMELDIKTHFLSDEQIKEYIWTAGYDVIFYKNIECEIIRKEEKCKKDLKMEFLNTIDPCDFSEEIKDFLLKKFMMLFFDKCKKDQKGNVLIPVKVTKMQLKNAGNFRLCLHPAVFNLSIKHRS